MHVGWRQHIERGPGMSEGPERVQRNGARPGWSWGNSSCVAVCGAVCLDAGVAKKASLGSRHGRISMGAMGSAMSWLLQSRTRMCMCV